MTITDIRETFIELQKRTPIKGHIREFKQLLKVYCGIVNMAQAQYNPYNDEANRMHQKERDEYLIKIAENIKRISK